MKKRLSKKAFTLVELIGVIIVLAIIGFIVYPTVNKIIIDNKQDILNSQIEEIERIAANWAVNNDKKLTYENGYSYYLYLDELYNDKYINEQEVYNPFTNEKMQGCVVISWYGGLNKHTYTYDESCTPTYPPTIGTDTNDPNNRGWYNEDIVINVQEGHLDKYTYCISDTKCEPNIDVETNGGQVIISTEGINYLCVNGTNKFGPTETICDIYKLDKTDPVLGDILVEGTQGLNEWYVSNVDVSNTESTDALSGLFSETLVPSAGTVDYDTKGITYTLTAIDVAGNTISTSTSIKVDVTDPEVGTIDIAGTKGTNEWYTSEVTFTINDGSDETSGHLSTTSNLSGINTNTEGTTVTVTTTDNAGNDDTRDYVIKVDMDKPTLTAKTRPFEIYVGDNVDSKTYFNTPTYSISGETGYECSPVNTSNLTAGTHTITCTATGGNGLYTTASVEVEVINPIYAVTLDQQSGTGGTTSVNAKYGSAMPTITLPTRTGYTFGGYYTGTNGSGTQYYTSTGASARNWDQYAEATLYAKWTANQYAVTLDRQSGTGGSSSANATYGSAMPSITLPSRTGYTFGGYYTGTSGSGTQYYTSAGASARNWDQAAADTLYAKWTANQYAVTLNKQSGTGGSSSATATYGSAMPSITLPSRTGYTFGGYYTGTSGSGTQYYTSAGASARNWDQAAADTLYAKWTANKYTVTLNKQSGTGGSSSATATYGSAMPSITLPSRTCYSFGGYYTSTGGSGTQYYTSTGASARNWDQAAADTLYAKWTENYGSISYYYYDEGDCGYRYAVYTCGAEEYVGYKECAVLPSCYIYMSPTSFSVNSTAGADLYGVCDDGSIVTSSSWSGFKKGNGAGRTVGDLISIPSGVTIGTTSDYSGWNTITMRVCSSAGCITETVDYYVG